MRRLLPRPAELEPEELYAGLTLPDGKLDEDGHRRPWVALGVVSSVDGAATVDGRTVGLGGEADRLAFSRLRDACDAILVGAGTLRTERYRPPDDDPARCADRQARGLAAVPRLVVVTAELELTPDHPAFADPDRRPLIVTHQAADVPGGASLAPVADVVRSGSFTVDLEGMLEHLASVGLTRIACEGGPTLSQTLLERDLVDEVFITVSPLLLGGSAPRVVRGAEQVADRELDLLEAYEHAGELLLRYRRPGREPVDPASADGPEAAAAGPDGPASLDRNRRGDQP